MKIEIIKDKLKQKKMLYRDLANITGVPLDTIKRIMSGRTPNPRIDTIRKIEQALDIDTTPKFVETYYTAQEERLIQIYRTLSDRDKKMVDNIFNSFASDVTSKNVRA